MERKNKTEKHSIYSGFHFMRFGFFLFAREYIKFNSYQFGLAIDWIKYDDAYLDIEFRLACFGVGIRFVLLNKISKLYGKDNSSR